MEGPIETFYQSHPVTVTWDIHLGTKAALLLLVLSGLLAGAPRWSKAEAGRWQVLTDAGDKAAATTLAELAAGEDLFRARATALGGRMPDSLPPVRVLLYRSARDLGPLRHAPSVRGVFVNGVDQDYILLAEPGADTTGAALHELFHLVARHSLPVLPAWLEEGLAEYHSTARAGEGNAMLSGLLAAHLSMAANGAWIDAQRFATMAAIEDGSFYAQSWATVYWLLQRPGGLDKLAHFIALMREGREQAVAFAEVYGISFEEGLRAARAAVPADAHHAGTADKVNFTPAAAPKISVQLAGEAEVVVTRAQIALALGQPAEAATLLNDAARRWPKDPSVAATLGALAMARADHAAARQHLENAMALGDKSAATQFEYAMLVRDTHGEQALVVQSLRQAAETQPSFGEAWFVLGNMLLNQGEPGPAADCLAKATALLPRRGPAWEALGRALHEAGRRAEARQAALRAVETAATPDESQMALALLREVDTISLPRLSAKPGVITPKGWEPPEGDSKVEGRLTMINCDTAVLVFTIQVKPGSVTALDTAKPQRVMLRGNVEGRREFVCGAQAGSPQVVAGYIARPVMEPPPPAPAPKTAPRRGAAARRAAPAKSTPAPVAGELVWLEFK